MADETTNTTASEQTTTPPTATPPAQTADGVTFTAEQQAHIDKLIGDARTKSREQAKADIAKAQTKAEKDAATARLTEQEQYKTLSEQHAARIAELEPLEARVIDYQKAIDTLLAAKLKALGDTAKKTVETLPGELDALAKLNWLNANEALFATVLPPNIGATARGRDNGDITFTDQEIADYAAEKGFRPQDINKQLMAADLRARAQRS